MGKELVSNSSESASANDEEEFSTSSASSTVTDLMEDASSSSSSLNGPLYQLTDLMAHLPIKRRGLSKYYAGKSQSFTSLGSVKMVEDLAKKENPLNKRMKLCSRSYGGGFCAPKPTIAKKPSSSSRGGSFMAAMSMVGRNDLLSSIPIHK